MKLKLVLISLLFSFAVAQKKTVQVIVNNNDNDGGAYFSNQLAYTIKENIRKSDTFKLYNKSEGPPINSYITLHIYALEIDGNFADRFFCYTVWFTLQSKMCDQFISNSMGYGSPSVIEEQSKLVMTSLENLDLNDK